MLLTEAGRRILSGGPSRKGRSGYQKFPEQVKPQYVKTGDQRTANQQGLTPVTQINPNLQGLDPKKMPSHIFFLASPYSGDQQTLNDINELNSELKLNIETQIASSAPGLNYLLGDTSSEYTETFQQQYEAIPPLNLKSLKNPPLILVDPFLFIGQNSRTAKDWGKDFIELLNELIKNLNLNAQQSPRVLLVRSGEHSIKELQSRYPYTLDPSPKHYGFMKGLHLAGEEDLIDILARYQKSL